MKESARLEVERNPSQEYWVRLSRRIRTSETMDEILPDHEAITVPVPSVKIIVKDQHKTFLLSDITHVVVQ